MGHNVEFWQENLEKACVAAAKCARIKVIWKVRHNAKSSHVRFWCLALRAAGRLHLQSNSLAPFFNLSELQKESGLTREHILLIVRQIAKTGQTLIIEGGLDTEAERTEIRNILREAGYNPALIWVQADATTIRNRLRAKLRSTAKAKAEYDAKIDVMEAPGEAESPIVLSGKHTYATQLKHVLTQLAM